MRLPDKGSGKPTGKGDILLDEPTTGGYSDWRLDGIIVASRW